MSVVTLAFWAVWFYFVTPLVTLVLWLLGVGLVRDHVTATGYHDMRQAILSYSLVLLGMVALLTFWIVWNVVRYSGTADRRTVKRPDVTDLEVWQTFKLDDSIHATLCATRLARIDLDETDTVVVISTATPRRLSPALLAALRLPEPGTRVPAPALPEDLAPAHPVGAQLPPTT